MDPQRFKEAYQRLEGLDDRLSHKIRPRSGSIAATSPEHLDARLRDLSSYTLELKEILRDVFHAIAAKPGSRTPSS